MSFMKHMDRGHAASALNNRALSTNVGGALSFSACLSVGPLVNTPGLA